MKSKNIFILIALLFGIALSAFVVFFVYKDHIKITSASNANVSFFQSNQNTVSLSVEPQTSQAISGISMRLTYDYSSQQKPNVELKVNADLISAGWTFPIKKVTEDDATKTLTVDVSGIIINTSGYEVSNQLNIATMDFTNEQIISANLKYDKTLTKLINKQGNAVPLNF